MNEHEFYVGLSKDRWEDIIDYVLYAIQSPISDDEEYQNGLQIIELIKEQMYD